MIMYKNFLIDGKGRMNDRANQLRSIIKVINQYGKNTRIGILTRIVYFSRPVQHDGIEIEILANICNINCEKLAIMRAKHFEIHEI